VVFLKKRNEHLAAATTTSLFFQRKKATPLGDPTAQKRKKAKHDVSRVSLFFVSKERVNNNLSLYAASFRRKLPIFLIK
jgi:hypothetical protein